MMNFTKMRMTFGGALFLGAALLGGAAHAQDEGNPVQRISVGTPVKVTLLQTISSETSNVGDRVRVRVAGDDKSGLPAGTVFVGRVTRVKPATPKYPGVIDMQLSALPLADNADAASVDDASAHVVGQTASSDKSNYVGIGAGAGAVIGLSRKGKLGDAAAGGVLGALGGYAANAAQKHSASDVTLKKGSEMTIKLDHPLGLRTEIIRAY